MAPPVQLALAFLAVFAAVLISVLFIRALRRSAAPVPKPILIKTEYSQGHWKAWIPSESHRIQEGYGSSQHEAIGAMFAENLDMFRVLAALRA